MMSATKEFMVALQQIETETPKSKNHDAGKTLMAFAGVFFVAAVVMSTDIVARPTQCKECKTILSILFFSITVILMIIEHELRQKSFKAFSCTSEDVKKLECMLMDVGLNLKVSYIKIKHDIELQRDAWREKIDALFHVATKGISLFVLTPAGFMFTLLLNTAYKDMVFNSTDVLSAETLAILSLCGTLFLLVLTALIFYAVISFLAIPAYEKKRYGCYLSFLEDVEVYYGQANNIESKQEEDSAEKV